MLAEMSPADMGRERCAAEQPAPPMADVGGVPVAAVSQSPCPGPAASAGAVLTESFFLVCRIVEAKPKLMLHFIYLGGFYFPMLWLFLTGKLLLSC